MGDSSDNQQDAFDYIHSMLGQLRTMAEAAQSSTLAYLIGMAYLEAGEMRGEAVSRARPDEGDGTA